MSLLSFQSIPTERKRHAETTESKMETDSKDVSDLEPDEIRHMMCPSNPPVHQDSTNTPAFFLCLVFTSVSFCNTVSAWSCLVWPTVSLFCLSGKGLAWRFHALFSVFPFLPLSMVGYSLKILSLFIFDCLCIPLTFAQITLSCSCFCQELPSSLNSLSCCPSL